MLDGLLKHPRLPLWQKEGIPMDALRALLVEVLGEKRLEHTLRVEREAVALAEYHGVDVHQTQKAALLHDIAKGLSIAEQIQFAEAQHIVLSKEDRDSPGVIHVYLGAFIAEHFLGVEDAAVLEAIRGHTTGPMGDALLPQIIYVADYLDPMRQLHNQDEIRNTARQSLHEAQLTIAISKNTYVFQKRIPLHPQSVAFYNHLLERHQLLLHPQVVAF